jgi:outer membrane protein assembly factor BamD
MTFLSCPSVPSSGILLGMFKISVHGTLRFLLFSLLLGVFLTGCATEKDTAGSEIRNLLGIDEDTAAPTEETIEQRYEPLAIMKRAESFYGKKNYIEAAGEYQRFLELHPLHRLAPYAQFRLAMSHFKQINTIDRDSEPLQKAMQAFQKLTEVYPNSPYVAEAKAKLAICRERLARYQLYIGNFYYKREAYPAAVYRFHKVIQEYGDLEIAAEAFYRLALSYQRLGETAQAQSALRLLLEKYPESDYGSQANGLMQKLNGKKVS